MSRPLFNASIRDLEVQFEHGVGNADVLRSLADELAHRSTKRAAQLRARVLRALDSLNVPERAQERVSAPPAPAPSSRPHTRQREQSTGSAPEGNRIRFPPIQNTPEAIMDAWTALEVLSPPTFRRPEELAGGETRAVASLTERALPWETGMDRARPKTRLYYQVVLGTMELDAATTALLSQYADGRAEWPPARGEAILALAILDREGRPVEAPAAAISSFGWGLPRALDGDLAGLAGWHKAERRLVVELDEKLRQRDEDGKVRPLDRATLTAAYGWLVRTLGLPPALCQAPRFAIRSYEYYRSDSPPEPLLLNSFYLGDLAEARDLFVRGRATPNLLRYVGAMAPAVRRNLLRDSTALEAAVAPGLTPPARWPGPGRHPLVLLQQAAVNLATSELRTNGILAVNGPPGTGKTTLLRDLVASVITERAEVLALFDDPEEAFVHSGERTRAGRAWLHQYRIDERLRGFEMLVASSNNKAVENVSAELPGLKAIATDAGELRYFATVSDALRGEPTWGLVAAVLGNAANRSKFKQTFWWDEDRGLSTYLAAAAGDTAMGRGPGA